MIAQHSLPKRLGQGTINAVSAGLSFTKFGLALSTVCRERAGQQSVLEVKHSPGVRSERAKVRTTLCISVTDPAALLPAQVTS